MRKRLCFTQRQFDEAFPTEPSAVMVYLDPPYSGSEAGYNAYWSEAHENRLYNYIKRLDAAGASFALSGVKGGHKDQAESPIITKLIADGHKVHEIEHDYSKVARNKDEKRGQEVLITNY